MNFVLLGPPGSGKGTQGEHLEAKLGIHRISTGELLRHEAESGSEIGNKIKTTLGSGCLVSDNIVISLLRNEITKSKYKKGFILDGFPRNLQQAHILKELLHKSKKSIDRVFYFRIHDDVLVERICNRYYCVKCGTNYNKLFKDPTVAGKCDICGGTVFNTRSDDSEDTIRKRLNEYRQKTEPLIAYYKNEGVLQTVDATKSIVEISKELDITLKNLQV